MSKFNVTKFHEPIQFLLAYFRYLFFFKKPLNIHEIHYIVNIKDIFCPKCSYRKIKAKSIDIYLNK